MLFHVVNSEQEIRKKKSPNICFLLEDTWDDWFSYSTLYHLIYYNFNNTRFELGQVKIAEFNMQEGQRRANLSKKFNSLVSNFFSLGQDESYYVNIKSLGDELRYEILSKLNDIALSPKLYKKAIKEDITRDSLLRSVNPLTVKGQFHRLAQGGSRLSKYNFTYLSSTNKSNFIKPIRVTFQVIPNSNPSTNIHVLIGRNGVGKTYLINNMVESIINKNAVTDDVGKFISKDKKNELFANIISVSFSAFDESKSLSEKVDFQNSSIRYCYIGLKQINKKSNKLLPPKSPSILTDEFINSSWICNNGARTERWLHVLKMLDSDPIFKASEVSKLCKIKDQSDFKTLAKETFKRFSSGHKIVLLTLTRLVEMVEERTLVLLDEPEGHLHPPLLSAFIRALSSLLILRNGVAIIATHSPVILQEVPKKCVWKIRRSGAQTHAERPEIETFGENVGILTHEIFGLEVTDSGYHQLIKKAVEEHDTYEDVINFFGAEIGMEAKAIIRTLMHNK